MHHPPPDFEPRVYTPQRIAAVVATLASDGIPAAQALAGSDLDETALRDPGTRVSYAQTVTVLRNALALARNPTVALRAGARMHLTAYGMWGYALQSSPTFSALIEFAITYRRAIGPLADMHHDPARAPGTCSFEVLVSPDPRDPLYRFALAFTFAAHLTLARDLYGDGFGFTGLRLACPAPEHGAGVWEAWFQCPVQFDQPDNALQFDEAWCTRAPRLHDPLTHAMASESCQQFVAGLAHAGGIAAAVRRKLVEQMPWRFPSIESMARTLALEPRTLRRRLATHGTTYRSILNEVRLRLAIEYLRKTRMTTEEIAERLGYSEAANFRHAFVRWTGTSPHAYRLACAPC